jgi:hypothetical protein
MTDQSDLSPPTRVWKVPLGRIMGFNKYAATQCFFCVLEYGMGQLSLHLARIKKTMYSSTSLAVQKCECTRLSLPNPWLLLIVGGLL